jgi:hypothetical protein
MVVPMSLEEWGTFIVSCDKPAEAEEFIRQCNVALARIPIDHNTKMGIEFHYKMMPGRKNKGLVYVFAKGLPIPKRISTTGAVPKPAQLLRLLRS